MEDLLEGNRPGGRRGLDRLVAGWVWLLGNGEHRRSVRGADDVGEPVDTTVGERLPELSRDARRRGRVVEDDRADLHGAGTGKDELECVEPGADATDAHDGHVRQRGVHLVDAAQRQWSDRRAGQAAGDTG